MAMAMADDDEMVVEVVSRGEQDKGGRQSKKVTTSPKDKLRKMVKTKTHGITERLSAGEYYRRHGKDACLGDVCDIRNNGELRCLQKRVNGDPWWAKPRKDGKGRETCGEVPWKANCKV